MEKRNLTESQITAFSSYLWYQEKSRNTIEKYLRDIKAFMTYIGTMEITKEAVIDYKNYLLSRNYAVRSINSMLASLHSFFSFLQ